MMMQVKDRMIGRVYRVPARQNRDSWASGRRSTGGWEVVQDPDLGIVVSRGGRSRRSPPGPCLTPIPGIAARARHE